MHHSIEVVSKQPSSEDQAFLRCSTSLSMNTTYVQPYSSKISKLLHKLDAFNQCLLVLETVLTFQNSAKELLSFMILLTS